LQREDNQEIRGRKETRHNWVKLVREKKGGTKFYTIGIHLSAQQSRGKRQSRRLPQVS